MLIYYTSEFSRRYKRLSQDIKEQAKEKEKIFCKNHFDPRLKTHKLNGTASNYWAFSVDYNYRIIFKFYEKNSVIFIAIGDHSIYKDF